jgi:hypothetical protein
VLDGYLVFGINMFPPEPNVWSYLGFDFSIILRAFFGDFDYFVLKDFLVIWY